MRLDLSKELDITNKKLKVAVIVTTIISLCLIASILLFVLLSNFKIQILMSILGSIICSLITLFLLFVIICYVNEYVNYRRIILSLINSKEEEIDSSISSISNNKITIRKGLSTHQIEIDNKIYFLLKEEMISELKINKKGKFFIKENFLVGYIYEK